MSPEDYTPIACHLHDEFEIAIMRAQPIDAELLEGGDWVVKCLLPLDTRIRDGEEFLVYRLQGSETDSEVRLDRVKLRR